MLGRFSRFSDERRARLRPGLGHLGVHLRDLPPGSTRFGPVLRLDDPLDLRGDHHLRFPPVISFLGGGVAFLLFFVFMVGQLFWVLRVMPETKGVPLEKMAAKLGLDKA